MADVASLLAEFQKGMKEKILDLEQQLSSILRVLDVFF